MSPFAKGLLLGIGLTLLITATGVAVGGKLIWDGLQLARQAIRTEAAEATETRAFPLADLRRISVATGVGDITVEAGDVAEVQVTARRVARAGSLTEAQDELPGIRWSAQVIRGRLILRQERSPNRREGADGARGAVSREVHFRVVVPQKAQLPVVARAGVGQIRLEGLQADVRAEAGVGDVEAQRVTGALTLESGTGDVVVQGGQGALSAEAGIGEVRVKQREGAFSLKTGTGDITAELAKITGAIEAETGIGGITFRVPRKVDARFELAAGIGHVTNDMRDLKPEAGANDHETVLVLGKGTHVVKAGTGTGDVRLKPGD